MESTPGLESKTTVQSLSEEMSPQGTLFERMATTINLEQSIQDIFKKFSNRFLEREFFPFVMENVGQDFALETVKIMIVKLLERGLLAQRAQDNPEQARTLGMLINYTRNKKMKLKKSKLCVSWL